MGSKMVLTFKEGNFSKKYYSSNDSLLSERFLEISKNKSYMITAGDQVVYWFDVSKQDSKTTFRQVSDSTIIGHSSIGITTETVVSGDGFGDETFNVSGRFYYAKDLSVNPDWYENYREGNFNEIIKVGKGVQLLIVNIHDNWEQIITATSIKWRNITDEEISMNLPDFPVFFEL